MYRNNAAACDRHLAKHMRDVLGSDETKNLKVMKIKPRCGGGDLHFCSCGKIADFYFRELEPEQREPGQPRTPVKEASGVPKPIPFPQQRKGR